MRDQRSIATDIPRPARARIEIDEDLTPRDAWIFAPLFAAVVALPLLAAVMLGSAAWHLAAQEIAGKPPVTFASRWPEREMPTVTR
jgi:hypothetical protein